jgi:nicotinic acetylcholine receptor
MIIDRIMLYIFFGVTLGGTLGILLSANTVFEFIDQAQILEKLKHSYQA